METPLGIFSRKTIHDINPRLAFDELMKRTRVLVIDDQSNEFPFEFLKKQGYSVDHWHDVQDLAKLESGFFDIIVLDIGGVGAELDADKEGVAVLTHVKRVNPSQVIVAYSGQAHRSAQIPFFKLADQYVPKPATAIMWKETIDELIKNTMSTGHYWGGLRQLLEQDGVARVKIEKLERELIRAIRKKAPDVQDRIKRILGPTENIVSIISIVAKIGRIAAMT